MRKVRFGQSKNNNNELGTEVIFVVKFNHKLRVVAQLMKNIFYTKMKLWTKYLDPHLLLTTAVLEKLVVT